MCYDMMHPHSLDGATVDWLVMGYLLGGVIPAIFTVSNGVAGRVIPFSMWRYSLGGVVTH